MRTITKLLFTFLAFITSNILHGQNILDKMDSAEGDVDDAVGQFIDTFWNYANILMVLLFIVFAVQAVRKSRANTDDDSGDGFSLPKFIMPKLALLGTLVLLEIITKAIT